MSEVLHKGGCHCGNVEFQVFAPSILDCVSCNCSICEKKQNVHFIVPKKKFRLICGEEFLTTYTFNTHQAKHIFCKVIHVHTFYLVISKLFLFRSELLFSFTVKPMAL